MDGTAEACPRCGAKYRGYTLFSPGRTIADNAFRVSPDRSFCVRCATPTEEEAFETDKRARAEKADALKHQTDACSLGLHVYGKNRGHLRRRLRED